MPASSWTMSPLLTRASGRPSKEFPSRLARASGWRLSALPVRARPHWPKSSWVWSTPPQRDSLGGRAGLSRRCPPDGPASAHCHGQPGGSRLLRNAGRGPQACQTGRFPPGGTHTCLQAVGAAWVETLDDGLETSVGAGGHQLTPEQAQQLALARLMLKDPPIAVLDEATAEAGTGSATMLDQAAEAALAGRTSVVIAHRLSQAASADTVVVMEHGQIVESGSHQELLSGGGRYAHLWEPGTVQSAGTEASTNGSAAGSCRTGIPPLANARTFASSKCARGRLRPGACGPTWGHRRTAHGCPP